MMTNKLISAIVSVSEKAGNIARICRQDEGLLSLLVQEKKDGEKNPRFCMDFKTLADVLVQEMVKHELCSKFPVLLDHVYGEENNEFLTEDGTIVIEIKQTEDETSDLLFEVLGNSAASKTLAKVVHSSIENDISLPDDIPDLSQNIGIWIDPIDSTAEYISGKQSEENGIILSGLPCVTVLIGVFDMDSGEPIIGVINQPFHMLDGERWSGRYIYGMSYNGFNISQPTFPLNNNNKAVAVSSTEKEEIKSALADNGYSVVEISGAGYKLMNVIMGNVQAYILSKPTSFLWDICACHAILHSIDGGILDFNSLTPIKYKPGKGVENCCNKGGILAYRNETVKLDLIKILKQGSKN